MKKIFEFIKSNRIKSIFGFLMLAYSILVGYNLIVHLYYGEQVEEMGVQLAVDLEESFIEEFGDLSEKKNGWEYFYNLPDIKDEFIENIEDEEYDKLSPEGKAQALKKIGAFNYCKALKKLDEYDMIIPPEFAPFNIDDVGNALWDTMHDLLKTKIALECIVACSSVNFEMGIDKQALEYTYQGFTYVEKLKSPTLIDRMIRIACASIISDHVSIYIDKYSAEDLRYFDGKIGKVCISKPCDYYNNWIYEAYQYCAWVVDDDVHETLGFRPNKFVFPGIIHPMNSMNKMIKVFLADNLTIYTMLKKNIDNGGYLNALQEATKIISEIEKDPKGHFFFALTGSMKSLMAYFESDAIFLIQRILIRQAVRKRASFDFNTVLEGVELSGLTIAEDGKELVFRGYRIGFIEKKGDGTDYVGGEGKEFAMYAIPLEYDLTGTTAFIVNEKNKIYTREFYKSVEIEKWPANLEKEGWDEYE